MVTSYYINAAYGWQFFSAALVRLIIGKNLIFFFFFLVLYFNLAALGLQNQASSEAWNQISVSNNLSHSIYFIWMNQSMCSIE